MTIAHHPTDSTLAAFTAGTLDEATTLVVAAHVERCATCRSATQAFGRFKGAAVDMLAPAQMKSDALQAAFAEIDAGAKPPAPPPDQSLLSIYGQGPWRWIGRGVYFASIDIPFGKDGARAFMLKADPGTRLPNHKHSDSELTCVLEGAFRHEGGVFGPGDFDEADDTVEHSPVIEPGRPCICIVALKGRVEFQGWIGRLLQPFVRL